MRAPALSKELHGAQAHNTAVHARHAPSCNDQSQFTHAKTWAARSRIASGHNGPLVSALFKCQPWGIGWNGHARAGTRGRTGRGMRAALFTGLAGLLVTAAVWAGAQAQAPASCQAG